MCYQQKKYPFETCGRLGRARREHERKQRVTRQPPPREMLPGNPAHGGITNALEKDLLSALSGKKQGKSTFGRLTLACH